MPPYKKIALRAKSLRTLGRSEGMRNPPHKCAPGKVADEQSEVVHCVISLQHIRKKSSFIFVDGKNKKAARDDDQSSASGRYHARARRLN